VHIWWIVPKVVELIRKNGQKNVKIFVGGIIPEEDVPVLLENGVHSVYGPGTSTAKVIGEIQKAVLKTVD